MPHLMKGCYTFLWRSHVFIWTQNYQKELTFWPLVAWCSWCSFPVFICAFVDRSVTINVFFYIFVCLTFMNFLQFLHQSFKLCYFCVASFTVRIYLEHLAEFNEILFSKEWKFNIHKFQFFSIIYGWDKKNKTWWTNDYSLPLCLFARFIDELPAWLIV